MMYNFDKKKSKLKCCFQKETSRWANKRAGSPKSSLMILGLSQMERQCLWVCTAKWGKPEEERL